MTFTGRLLVATPFIADPNFERTVVLILAHSDEGALGVILNRPSLTAVAEVVEEWAPYAAEPGMMFIGGPVGQNAVVLRNDGGNRNNWLTIRTVGTTSNRDGIGCLVKVVSPSGLSQSFTVNTAVGYLSASDKRLLVGLGSDATAKLVEIRWPSGVVQRFEEVAARQTLTATEPAK